MRAGRRFARSIAARIAASLHPEKIILFGSYAYGRPKRDSDLDFLVITRSRGHASVIAQRLHGSIENRPMSIDFVVVTPAQVRRRLAGFDPVLGEILSKGVVLHAERG